MKLTYSTGYAYAAGTVVKTSVSFADVDLAQQAVLTSPSFLNPVTSFGASGILGLDDSIFLGRG